MMRDRVGSFMSEAGVSRYLNRWISQYVLLNGEAGQETKARYPLREARIDVSADPAWPGGTKALVFLRPHFQLEELTVSIRLVTELPPPAGAWWRHNAKAPSPHPSPRGERARGSNLPNRSERSTKPWITCC
jgi:hypothetical protein